jgi:hypothetical protein
MNSGQAKTPLFQGMIPTIRKSDILWRERALALQKS